MAQSGHVGRRNECVLLGVKIQQTALVKSIHTVPPTYHRRMVRQELYGFLYWVGAMAVFFAFNLFAFNTCPARTSTGSF